MSRVDKGVSAPVPEAERIRYIVPVGSPELERDAVNIDPFAKRVVRFVNQPERPKVDVFDSANVVTLVDVKPIEELVSAVSADKIDVLISLSDADRALRVLDFIDESDKKLIDGENIELVIDKKSSRDILYRVNRAIINAGVEIATVSHRENKRLEDVFIEITGTEGGGQIE